MLSATVAAHRPDHYLVWHPDWIIGSTAIASADDHINLRPGLAPSTRRTQTYRPDLRRSERSGQHRATRETSMNMAKWVLWAVLAMPILELAAFIAVAATIGFGWALSLIFAGSVAGLLILRHAGGAHIARIRVALGEGTFTALQADSKGGVTLLAGILLVIPGFISDVVALLLLIGPLRRGIGDLF